MLADYPQAQNKVLFNTAVKAMNDTISEKDLFPSLLVFGITPRFPIISTNVPTQAERMKIMASAKMEMNAIIAEKRVQAAVPRQIPPATDLVYQMVDEVLVFIEKEGNWIGLFVVMHVRGRMITIHHREETYPQTFNAFELKPYYRDHSPIIYHRTGIFRSPLVPKPPFSSFITEEFEPSKPRASKF